MLVPVHRTAIHDKPVLKDGKQEWRFSSRRGGHVLRRSKDNIDRWETVGSELASAPKVRQRVTIEVGDHKEINITARMVGALGVRAEEHDALGCEGADIALHDSPEERWRILRVESGLSSQWELAIKHRLLERFAAVESGVVEV